MKTILTGIKPTGVPHIGNFFGAIKPAIESANNLNAKSFLFIADYHALTTVRCAKELDMGVKMIACTWLACGLDITKTVFYKQSDVPQIFELSTILSNVTPKGLLDRSHAFKAAIDAGHDVNMGLYNYPVLMAADILAFDTDLVPVGKDQQQHVEITSDIAKAFNAVFGKVLTVPLPDTRKEVAVLPGLDGRKMSKSYGNVIPLFADKNELKKVIARIVTDSSSPTEPKSTECTIYDIYKLFASEDELGIMKEKFSKGVGWGEVKSELLEVMDSVLSPMREKYNYYMNNFHEVEKVLKQGAEKAKIVASETIKRVRKSVGAS